MEVAVAILSVLTALIGLIAMIFDKKHTSSSHEAIQSNDGSYLRLIIYCIIVYAATGIFTAILSVFATVFTESKVFWASTHTCWFVGHLTIIAMILYKVKRTSK
jgi:hypothetical protein